MSKSEAWQLSMEAAELYECYVARHILGPWAPLLVDAAEVSRGQRVLDVACGTGVVARAAAERVGNLGYVAGIDLNPAMIAVASSLPASPGVEVEYFERSAVNLLLERESFDVVLCQQGLQFVPDMARALREMHRVLRKHGRIALSVWNDVGLYNSALGRALGEFLGQDVANRFLVSRKVPKRHDLEQLAIGSGFTQVDVRVDRAEIHLPCLDEFVIQHLSATPVAAEIVGAEPALRDEIGAHVQRQLSAFSDGDGVTYPEETHVLTARAF